VIRHLFFVILLGGCAGARGPGDDVASRCGMGLDMLESARCGPQVDARFGPVFRVELERFQADCKDPASRTRIAKIETACVPRYAQAKTAMESSRRQVRAKYVAQVSELLLDPEYGPAADRYRDAKERQFNDQRDPGIAREVNAASAALATIAQRHGIDPSLGKDLDLW
jgi:hypothetical protein